jgi:cell division protein FtsQ
MKLIILSGIIYIEIFNKWMVRDSMNNQMKVKYSNELISMRKRKAILKRSIVLLILLSVVSITLSLKLPYFNIKEILVVNNRVIASEEIVKLSEILKGNNIFYINVKKIKTNFISNPYIYDVGISRKLPHTIQLEVKERNAAFYLVKDNKYLILDSNGTILEIRDSVKGLDLVRIYGITFNAVELGKVIEAEDSRKIKVLTNFAELIRRNSSDIKISSIDISDLLNINVLMGNMNGKLGNYENIETKLNKVFNIMNRSEVKNSKGYIDVSFEGNPVVHIEN